MFQVSLHGIPLKAGNVFTQHLGESLAHVINKWGLWGKLITAVKYYFKQRTGQHARKHSQIQITQKQDVWGLEQHLWIHETSWIRFRGSLKSCPHLCVYLFLFEVSPQLLYLRGSTYVWSLWPQATI